MLRDFLQAISQVSFSYNIISRQHPISKIDGMEAEELKHAYEDLVEKVRSLVTQFENEYEEYFR